MFSKKQRHQIYKLALEKLENDTHPLIADNVKYMASWGLNVLTFQLATK